jgi:hypothetical protein
MAHGSWVEEMTILNRQDAKDAKELKAGMLEGAFSVFWSWISIVLGERFCAGRAWDFAIGGKTRGLFVEGPGAFLAEPLVAVAGVVARSLFVLLDEPGVVHGTQLADEDGFGFLIEFGGEGHGSETMSMGLRMLTISWLECRFDFLSSPSSLSLGAAGKSQEAWTNEMRMSRRVRCGDSVFIQFQISQSGLV